MAHSNADAAGGSDLRRADHDGGVQVVPADERGDPAVVATSGPLVAVDHPEGVHQRAAHDGGREHGPPDRLDRVERGAPGDEVAGVRQVRHPLQVRAQRLRPPVTHRPHHLQFLVEDHVELIGLLAVGEEVDQPRDRGPARRIAVRAADRVHGRHAVRQGDVALRGRADERAPAGVDQERPVRSALLLQQAPEDREGACQRVVGDRSGERPADDEVAALPGADLLLDDPAHDVLVCGVGRCRTVRPELRAARRGRRTQRLGQRHPRPVPHRHHQQRGPGRRGNREAMHGVPSGTAPGPGPAARSPRPAARSRPSRRPRSPDRAAGRGRQARCPVGGAGRTEARCPGLPRAPGYPPV